MAISLWILLRVFTWLTPVDEWEELKKGNVGIAKHAHLVSNAWGITFETVPVTRLF
jgi:uncharacterized membrane protein YjfL (UPF0719 family)